MPCHCVCGNFLRETTYKMRESPCRCDEPGPGSSFLRQPAIRVTEAQYNERRKHGLPIQLDCEKSLDHDWV